MYLFSVIYSYNECHLIDEFYHIKFLKTTTKVDTKAFLKTLRNNISKKHRQKSRRKYLPVVAESHLFSHTAWVCLVTLVLFIAPCVLFKWRFHCVIHFPLSVIIIDFILQVMCYVFFIHIPLHVSPHWLLCWHVEGKEGCSERWMNWRWASKLPYNYETIFTELWDLIQVMCYMFFIHVSPQWDCIVDM